MPISTNITLFACELNMKLLKEASQQKAANTNKYLLDYQLNKLTKCQQAALTVQVV